MPTPEHKRLQGGATPRQPLRGDWAVPAPLVNAHSEQLEALRDPSVEGGLIGDLLLIPSAVPEGFLATITATDAGNPPAYSWSRQEGPDGAGAPVAPEIVSTGAPADWPAFEQNGNPDVPIGAVVKVWPSSTDECYYFSYPPLTGTLTQDVTFTGTVTITGDVVWTSTATETYQSGSLTTVNQGAVFVFQSSSSAGTAPGILSVPTLTAAGPPTWTPGAGTYPVEYSTVDGGYWQWNGTAWTFDTFATLTSPLTTKGDIWVHNGTTDDRMPVGTDTYVLTANSAEATGLKYVDPVTIATANTAKLGADFTTTSSTFVDVTGLSFAVAANTDYLFDFVVVYTNSGNPAISLNGPAGATWLAFMAHPVSASPFSAQNTAYDAVNTPASSSTKAVVRLTGVLRNGANAGTVVVRVKVATGTITVYRGSGVEWS